MIGSKYLVREVGDGGRASAPTVLSTKAWGSSDEGDVQGVDGEAMAGCCL